MTSRSNIAVVGIAFFLLVGCSAENSDSDGATTVDPRPNILIIVADDMGYNDLGAWGSEIPTPNLDKLALNGLRFTNFHAAPVCAPARTMLMSGSSNHRGGVGSMDIKRVYDSARALDPELIGFGQPGYEGHLSERVAALPEVLSSAGYHTYMTGKWDLGRALETTHMPASRGFESSFILTTGSAVHLGFPDGNASGGLYRADPYPYQENGESVTALGESFFSTEMYTSKLIDYIDENRGDGQPFFAWLAYTAPHWPLQLPDDWRDRNAGRYDDGYDVLRQQRFARAQDLGLYSADLDLSDFESGASAWDTLTAEERAVQSRAMEIYAGMIESMDFHIGRLVSYLDETDQLENTLILFFSDNGADAAGVPSSAASYDVDDSLENMGRVSSWVRYGRGWARAATAPFRDIKGSMSEGGTRVAAFVSGSSVAVPGNLDDGYLSYMDIAPTALDIAGVPIPSGTFEGREILPMTGRSFWGRALGDNEPVYGPNDPIGFELHGARALVRGDWKILMPEETGVWELFNLAEDIGEMNDLAGERPELLQELVADWEAFAAEHGVIY